MKVLMLVIDKQRIQLDCLYEGIAKHCDLDLRRLSSKEQDNIAKYFKHNVDTKLYSRIIMFLRFKKEIRQVAFIRTIPNLVILEHDAWQNYYPQSKYQNKFSRHYSALPWVRVLVSGATLSKRLCKEGFDAHFVSKGYDQSLLKNTQQERSIELGFIGNTGHDTYIKRKELLETARDNFGLHITRTNSGHEYLETLNNIRFFLSADIGFGENMVKNFEAMACGCVLIAYNQGEEENQILGFIDMKNVVLYDSIESLEKKLGILRENQKLAEEIAKSGQQLAETSFTFDKVGNDVIKAITSPLKKQEKTSILDVGKYFFRR